MFTRRVATFLLGMWLGCCLLVDALLLQGHSVADRILNGAVGDAKALIAQVGQDRAAVLLHNLSGESLRGLLNNWEPAQLVLAFLIGVLLTFTDSRKPAAIALCVVMAALTFIQQSFLTPEWNSLGRQLDFMPGPESFNLRTQIWTITRGYAGVEILKILVGGMLASYFFAMESVVKRKAARRSESSQAKSASR